MKDLELEDLEFLLVRDFFVELKKEFSRENSKLAKITKLKRVKQRSKTIEEFV